MMLKTLLASKSVRHDIELWDGVLKKKSTTGEVSVLHPRMKKGSRHDGDAQSTVIDVMDRNTMPILISKDEHTRHKSAAEECFKDSTTARCKKYWDLAKLESYCCRGSSLWALSSKARQMAMRTGLNETANIFCC